MVQVFLGVKGVMDILKAEKNDKQADKINVKAFEKMATAEEQKNEQDKLTRKSLEKLANRKKGILITSMSDFIKTYEKIMKIDFKESDGIKELNWTSMFPELIHELRSITSTAGMTMTDRQAIATFVIGGVTGYIKKESELNLTAASIRKKQANVIESQFETICVALDAIKQRADRISELLAKLNLLFRKSIETTEKIIESRGNNRANYIREDKEYIMTCINFATTIKKIIDTKLIDDSGEITQQSIEAIKIGEEYLSKINSEISK